MWILLEADQNTLPHANEYSPKTLFILKGACYLNIIRLPRPSLISTLFPKEESIHKFYVWFIDCLFNYVICSFWLILLGSKFI